MIRPKQKISTAAKFKGTWIEDNAFYFRSICKKAIDDAHANLLLRVANGELIESDYTYVENPLNTDNDKHKRFPAKIRNYDIINSIVMMLMGEKRRRGVRYTVVARNSEIASLKEELIDQAIDQQLTQMFVNSFIQYTQQFGGMEVDMEQAETLSTDEIQKQASKIQDRLAISGQTILDYIFDFNLLDNKFTENWFYWVVLGRTFSYREPFRDEVLYQTVPPNEMYYTATSLLPDLQYAEAQMRRTRMPLNQVIDRFQGVKGFTEDVEKELEAKLGYGNSGFEWNEIRNHSEIDPGPVAFSELLSNIRRKSDTSIYSDEEGVSIEHVVWTSMVKIGLLTTINLFGDIIQIEVDEDFKPMAGENVSWIWAEQKWQAWILDDKHVVGGEPIPFCQGDYYRPDGVKGPYNGKILNMKGTNPKSLVERGLPYQIKYNIIHYYIEKIIAKNLDKLVVVPLSLIPEKEGLDMEAAMYYAQAMSMLFVDDSNPKSLQSLNGLKVLDAQLGQSLNQLYSILQGVKSEWEDSVGAFPQRKGQMNASDGKAVTENAVFRSSLMTEEYFAQFEEFQESDLQYCMELSKFAFSEGKQSVFHNHELKQAILNVTGEEVVFSDWNVRVSSSGKDLEELDQAKGLAQAFAQNSEGRFSTAIKAIKANNISKLVEEMELLEQDIQAQVDANAQADREAQTYAAEQVRIAAEIKAEQDRYKVDQDNATKIEVARMTNEARLMSEFYNPVDSSADVARFNETAASREIEMTKIQADREKSVRDAEAKKYVADRQLDVARENKSM